MKGVKWGTLLPAGFLVSLLFLSLGCLGEDPYEIYRESQQRFEEMDNVRLRYETDFSLLGATSGLLERSLKDLKGMEVEFLRLGDDEKLSFYWDGKEEITVFFKEKETLFCSGSSEDMECRPFNETPYFLLLFPSVNPVLTHQMIIPELRNCDWYSYDLEFEGNEEFSGRESRRLVFNIYLESAPPEYQPLYESLSGGESNITLEASLDREHGFSHYTKLQYSTYSGTGVSRPLATFTLTLREFSMDATEEEMRLPS